MHKLMRPAFFVEINPSFHTCGDDGDNIFLLNRVYHMVVIFAIKR